VVVKVAVQLVLLPVQLVQLAQHQQQLLHP
jgi:hypothetical protein